MHLKFDLRNTFRYNLCKGITLGPHCLNMKKWLRLLKSKIKCLIWFCNGVFAICVSCLVKKLWQKNVASLVLAPIFRIPTDYFLRRRCTNNLGKALHEVRCTARKLVPISAMHVGWQALRHAGQGRGTTSFSVGESSWIDILTGRWPQRQEVKSTFSNEFGRILSVKKFPSETNYWTKTTHHDVYLGILLLEK